MLVALSMGELAVATCGTPAFHHAISYSMMAKCTPAPVAMALNAVKLYACPARGDTASGNALTLSMTRTTVLFVSLASLVPMVPVVPAAKRRLVLLG